LDTLSSYVIFIVLSIITIDLKKIKGVLN